MTKIAIFVFVVCSATFATDVVWDIYEDLDYSEINVYDYTDECSCED